MSPTSISISSFVQDALDHFKELGYGKATIKTHTIVYGKLLCYAQLHHHNEYCAEVGEAFLAKEKDRLHPDTFYYYSLAIQRLDCFNSGIEWHPKERVPRKKPYTTCFDPLVNEVMEKLKDRGYATATIGKYDTVYRDLEQYCRLKAVHMAEADMPIIYIRNFLGHASIKSTEIYARIGQAAVTKALSNRKFPELAPDAELVLPEQDRLPAFLMRTKKIM